MKNNPAIISLLRQKELLQIEYEEEKASFTKITEKEGLEKLKARGNAWSDIVFDRSFYNSLNQRIVEIHRLPDDEEEDHNFEYGRPVMFFSITGGFQTSIIPILQGEVSYVDGLKMLVAVPENANIGQLIGVSSLGVMISFDETTYRAMFEALDRTIDAKGRLGELRDLIYSGRPMGKLSLSQMKFPYLNIDQELSVNNILAAKDVAIVHGPPGTGKTTTLVEAIYETLRREPQVMVCAQSNMAVDWICEKLVDRGVNVLRIGNPSRVNDKMLSFTYERRFESHPLYPDLWGIRNNLRHLHKEKGRTESWHQKLDRLKSKATELEIRINNDLFSSANVIASTLTGSSHRVLSGMKFTTLFIDEAAQALEAATWIPIRKAGRVIFAGDHCQLPPVVKSFTAMKEGLGKSLMERISENHPEAVTLLTLQYRMNRHIMEFSNRWFYGGMMKAAGEVKDRIILDGDFPIEWVDTSEWENKEGWETDNSDSSESFRETLTGNYGRINVDEALLTLLTLQKYIESISVRRLIEERIDIGVISPYRAQAIFLRKMLKKVAFFKPVRKLISINTIDGFQGQEKDVIIISMVRSNDEGRIGFLNDLRRMNVAMTRARMKLIIIGNSRTLSKHKFYHQLIDYINSLSE